ncbi:MAG: HAMP domain-containing protein [Desulfuromonadales bacterium]|nr:HAMP domain-containing protein [Desulfuromonadales bacterium]
MFISLRTKSLLSHLAIVLAVTLVVTGFTYHLMRRDYLLQEERNLTLLAAVITEEIDHLLSDHRNILERLAMTEGVEAAIQGRFTPLLTAYFAKFQKDFPILLGIDREERVRMRMVHGLLIDSGEELAERLGVQAARQTSGEVVIGSARLCLRTGRPVVDFARSIGDHGLAGALIGAVFLDEILHPVQWAEVGRRSFAWVIDEQQRVIGGLLSEGATPFLPLEEARKNLIGPRDLVKMTAIPRTAWSVMVVLPYDAAMAGPVRIRNLSLLLALTILLVGSGTAYLLAARITNPLRQLTAAVQQVSQGELKPVPELRVKDEVGILVASFNQMVENLRRTTFSRDYVDTLLHSMNDALLVIAPDDTLRTVNRRACTLIGLASEELTGTPAATVFGPPPTAADSWFAALRTEPDRSQVEGALLGAGGRTIPVILSWSPLPGPGGRVDGMICVAQDMTERRQMEQALRFIAQGVAAHTGEGFFRALVDHLAEALQLRIALLAVSITPTFCRALAFRNGSDYLDEMGYDQSLTPCGKVIRDNMVVYIPDNAGGLYPKMSIPGLQSYLGVPIPDSAGKVVGNLAVADDRPMAHEPWKLSILQIFALRAGAELERAASERRQQESAAALARSNRELEEFAYIASHDLQEPLRKITVFGDRLQNRYREHLDEQGHDYLARMLNAGARMQRLIEDLLSYSRVSSRSQPFAPTNLNQILREVLTDLEVSIDQSGAEIEAGELPTIEADPLQMRQLLQNLIGNALKFHRPGIAPRVQITATGERQGERPEQPHFWRLGVRDHGIGFDQQHAERIFTVFHRLHGRSEYEGTGVGLAICRKIAQRHGGSIEVRSTPGEGTLFEVLLPFFQPDEVTR